MKADIERLCGGCQKWGANPRISDDKCIDCDRWLRDIRQEHGAVILDDLTKACIFAIAATTSMEKAEVLAAISEAVQ